MRAPSRPSPTRLAEVGLTFLIFLAGACGPVARIPALPARLPSAVAADDSTVRLARGLAPTLYLQRDEWFRIERTVAVVHPTERLIAYHLLWRDDVHGAWLPFTVPTDQEILWLRYDEAGRPVRVWTYWHGAVLETDWTGKGRVEAVVQWGKHGMLPKGIREGMLPADLTLNVFYAFTWIGLPDILLSRLQRRGPKCFCHSYRRYREFTRPLDLAQGLDVIVRTSDPADVLSLVFGKQYSRKEPWPKGGAR